MGPYASCFMGAADAQGFWQPSKRHRISHNPSMPELSKASPAPLNQFHGIVRVHSSSGALLRRVGAREADAMLSQHSAVRLGTKGIIRAVQVVANVAPFTPTARIVADREARYIGYATDKQLAGLPVTDPSMALNRGRRSPGCRQPFQMPRIGWRG